MSENKQPAPTPRVFRRTLVGDVLYPPIVAQYDRRRYGDETVRAILATNGSEEELTEFQACIAMGETTRALEFVKSVAEQIRPQVLAEARRDARKKESRYHKQAVDALSSGHVSAQAVSPWVRIALEQNRLTLKGLSQLIDRKGQFHQFLCRYFSHLPFADTDMPDW